MEGVMVGVSVDAAREEVFEETMKFVRNLYLASF